MWTFKTHTAKSTSKAFEIELPGWPPVALPDPGGSRCALVKERGCSQVLDFLIFSGEKGWEEYIQVKMPFKL